MGFFGHLFGHLFEHAQTIRAGEKGVPLTIRLDHLLETRCYRRLLLLGLPCSEVKGLTQFVNQKWYPYLAVDETTLPASPEPDHDCSWHRSVTGHCTAWAHCMSSMSKGSTPVCRQKPTSGLLVLVLERRHTLQWLLSL
jgi:hypothetical protein